MYATDDIDLERQVQAPKLGTLGHLKRRGSPGVLYRVVGVRREAETDTGVSFLVGTFESVDPLAEQRRELSILESGLRTLGGPDAEAYKRLAGQITAMRDDIAAREEGMQAPHRIEANIRSFVPLTP